MVLADFAFTYEGVMLWSGGSEIFAQPCDESRQVGISEGAAAAYEEQRTKCGNIALEEITHVIAKGRFIVADAEDAACRSFIRTVEMQNRVGLPAHECTDFACLAHGNGGKPRDELEKMIIIERTEGNTGGMQGLNGANHLFVGRLCGMEGCIEPAGVHIAGRCPQLAAHELSRTKKLIEIAGVDLRFPVRRLRGCDFPLLHTMREAIPDETLPWESGDLVVCQGDADSGANDSDEFAFLGGLPKLADGTIARRGNGFAGSANGNPRFAHEPTVARSG